MNLFDDIQRDYRGPALYQEDEFRFINRSARPAAAKVRTALESFYIRYCADEKPRLRTRFRSEFWSAFFELVLHEYLTRVAESVSCHPEIGTTGKQPDFIATFRDGTRVVVEAVLALDLRTDEQEETQAVLAPLLDEINRVDSPNFYLGIKDLRNPDGRQPSGRKIRAFLAREMAGLDPDVVQAEAEKGRPFPDLVFNDGSFRISFDLIPKSEEHRGDPSIRPIGCGPVRSRWGASERALSSAVCRKATRYGDLGVPYVVALNVLSEWGLDADDVMDALFGTEQPFVLRGDTDVNVRRRPDGVWVGPAGPKNTRLSSVLVASLLPWNLPRAEFRMIHNPWAQHAASHLPWRIPSNVPGEQLGAILGLQMSWPGDLFD